MAGEDSVASLGLAVDSTQTVQATAALQALADAGEHAEAVLAKLGVTSLSNLKNVSSGAKDAGDSVVDLTGNLGSLGDELVRIGLYAASFEALKDSVLGLISAQAEYQRTINLLESSVGTQQDAVKEFGFLASSADAFGFSLQRAQQEYGKFSTAAAAYDVPLAQRRELFLSLNQAILATGGSSNQAQRALYGLQEMFDRGTIQARQFYYQIGTAIPQVVPLFEKAAVDMEKQMGNTNASFDKLMKSGQLVTATFVPALIQAFNQVGSSTAITQATESIYADLNRLSNAWYQLKVQTSQGLFSEVATASIRAITDNLKDLADAATVVAGVLLLRFTGGVFGGLATSINEGVTALVTERTAAIGAASAMVELRSAEVLEANAAQLSTSRKLEAAQAQRGATLAALAEAVGRRQAAQASLQAIEAAGAEATAIRYYREATTEATIATGERTNAVLALRAAQASEAALEAQLAAQTTALATAQANAAAATTALTEATSLSALAGRGLMAAGSGLLSILGGWPGVILAAGAALVYLATRESDAEKATDKLTDALKRSKNEATGETAGLFINEIGAALEQAQNKAAAAKAEMASLNAELARVQARPQTRASIDSLSDNGAGQIQKIQDQIAQLSTVATQANNEVARLRAMAIDALGNTGITAEQFVSSLKGTFETLDKTTEKLKEQTATYKQGKAAVVEYQLAEEVATAKRVLSGNELAKALQLLHDKYDNAIQIAKAYDEKVADTKAATKQQNAVQAYLENLDKEAAKLQFQVANYAKYGTAVGTAASAVAAFELQYGKLSTVKDPAVIKQITDAAGAVTKLGESLHVLEALKQSTDQIAQLNAQTAVIGKSTAELKTQQLIQELVNKGIAEGTAEYTKQAAAIRAAVFANDSAQEAERLRQYVLTQKNSIETATLLAASYALNAQELQKLTYARQLDVATQQAALTLTDEEIAKRKQADEVLKKQYNDAIDAQTKFKQTYAAGFYAFYNDMVTKAQDNAALVKTAFENAFNDIGSAIAKFVTTGKLNFGDLVRSILADLAKLETEKLLAQLLTTIGGAFGVSTPTAAGSSVAVDTPHALGGSVRPGTIVPVNERGFETFSTGGKDYLLSGEGGTVHSASEVNKTTNQGNQYSTQIVVQVGQSGTTEGQVGDKEARNIGQVLKTAVLAVIIDQQRPGGALASTRQQ